MIKSQIPNILSFLRICASFVSIYFFYTKSVLVLFSLLIFIAASDALDGFLARRWNCASSIGAILDPMGDKIATGTYLIGLHLVWNVGGIIMFFVLMRDIGIFCTFLFLKKRYRMADPHVTFFGKLNTVTLASFVLGALLNIEMQNFVTELWQESFYWLTLLTLVLSTYSYVKVAGKVVRS